MNHDVTVFLQGIGSTAAYVSSLFFFRFWRDSRDPLFGFFGAAFCLFGLSWTLLALFAPTGDTRPYVYGLRLVAFALIIAGTISANRRRAR
jgi:hypothetical protein